MHVSKLSSRTSSVSVHGQRAVLPRSTARPPRAAASNGNGNGNQRRQASKPIKGSVGTDHSCGITACALNLPPSCAGRKQGPDYKNVQRNLALELVRVTEAAALAGGKWYGRGDKNAADQVSQDCNCGCLLTTNYEATLHTVHRLRWT